MRKSKISKMRRRLKPRLTKRIKATLERTFRHEPGFAPVALRFVMRHPMSQWFGITKKLVIQAGIIKQNLNL